MKKNKIEWKKIKQTNFNHEINIIGQLRNVKSKKKLKPKSYSYRVKSITIGSINELRWEYFKGEMTSNLYFRGWKKISAMYPKSKPYYFVNKYGDVYNAKLDRFIQTNKKKDGYLSVHIKPKEVLQHRIIGLFIPITEKYKHLTYKDLTIDHINSIRDDNRIENLRWMTLEDNLSISHKGRVYKKRKPFVSTSSL